MPKKKVSVSIDKTIYERADELAQEMGISRSRLHEMAVEYYLERAEGQSITEQLNKVYADPATVEEQRAIARAGTRTLRRLLQDDEW